MDDVPYSDAEAAEAREWCNRHIRNEFDRIDAMFQQAPAPPEATP